MLEEKYFKGVSSKKETPEPTERDRTGAAMLGAGDLPGPFPLWLSPPACVGMNGAESSRGEGRAAEKASLKRQPPAFSSPTRFIRRRSPARRALPSGSARAPQYGGPEGARARHGGGGGGGGPGLCPRCVPSGLAR